MIKPRRTMPARPDDKLNSLLESLHANRTYFSSAEDITTQNRRGISPENFVLRLPREQQAVSTSTLGGDLNDDEDEDEEDYDYENEDEADEGEEAKVRTLIAELRLLDYTIVAKLIHFIVPVKNLLDSIDALPQKTSDLADADFYSPKLVAACLLLDKHQIHMPPAIKSWWNTRKEDHKFSVDLKIAELKKKIDNLTTQLEELDTSSAEIRTVRRTIRIRRR